MNNKQHWEKIYTEKEPGEVSWAQDVPSTSLSFIQRFSLPKTAGIIDIGGGDSKLVDFLLQEGYTDISVLDISAQSLHKAKQRLGNKAEQVKWIVSDILEFKPERTYDVWHDRAAFHFLTEKEQVNKYLSIVSDVVDQYLIIGTFSHEGPTKCSGLSITQYNEAELQDMLSDGFEKIKCITEDHTTPANTKQNFTFCSFRALN